MNEKTIQAQIHRAIGGRDDVRLFRNQVGTYKLPDGRWITSGLAKGSADLIGWQTVEITPDMVGQKIAVFLSLEIKAGSGRVRPDQENWQAQVKKAGGIAAICRTVIEAEKSLYDRFPRA